MADREAGAGRELAGHGSRVEGREAIGTCEAQGKKGSQSQGNGVLLAV